MPSPFTDNDIQDYLEGVYTGNINALEDYLQNTEEGRKRVESFNAMFRMLRSGPVPSLKIDLDEAVLLALDTRQRKPFSVGAAVLWIVIGLCIATALVFGIVLVGGLSFFNQFENSLLMSLTILLLVLLLFGFHGIDWYRQHRRYSRTMI